MHIYIYTYLHTYIHASFQGVQVVPDARAAYVGPTLDPFTGEEEPGVPENETLARLAPMLDTSRLITYRHWMVANGWTHDS